VETESSPWLNTASKSMWAMARKVNSDHIYRHQRNIFYQSFLEGEESKQLHECSSSFRTSAEHFKCSTFFNHNVTEITKIFVLKTGLGIT
jgi:hypothetical protein